VIGNLGSDHRFARPIVAGCCIMRDERYLRYIPYCVADAHSNNEQGTPHAKKANVAHLPLCTASNLIEMLSSNLYSKYNRYASDWIYFQSGTTSSDDEMIKLP